MKNAVNLSIDQSINQSYKKCKSPSIISRKTNFSRPISSYNSMTRASTGKYKQFTNGLNSHNSSTTNLNPISSTSNQAQNLILSDTYSSLQRVSSTKLIYRNAINNADRKNIRRSTGIQKHSKILELIQAKEQSFPRLQSTIIKKRFNRQDLWNALNKTSLKVKNATVSNISYEKEQEFNNHCSDYKYDNDEKKKKKAEQNEYIQKANSKNIDLNAAKKLFKFEHILNCHKENLNEVLKDQMNRKKGSCIEPYLRKFIPSKDGFRMKPLEMSTIALKEHTPEVNFLQRQLEKHDGRKVLNKTIKLQCIAWLWMHKKVLIERLLLCYSQFKWFFDKEKTITKRVIEEFMRLTYIEKDELFVKNIFLLFEHNKSGSINFQEVMINFILSNDSTYESNISLLVGLLTDKNISSILLQDFVDLLKWMITAKEMKKVIEIFKTSFSYNEHKEIFVTFHELSSFLNDNEIMVYILKSKMVSYTQLIINYEQEMANASLMNIKNPHNCLMDHGTKSFMQSEYKQLSKVLEVVQCCKESRKTTKKEIDNNNNNDHSSEESSLLD